ncbi:cytochrome P450 [Jatrophihabitans sp.]|uniref:cytochrome P450 n=1 Tax=Jatrophihabitans sp. TaxID=1932789 RepID=UPI0030C6BAF0|nr:cytochrome [Jatrophihabitans sp.]
MTVDALQDFHFDPFEPAVTADPLPFYRELREHHPVYYHAGYDAWILSRFQDVYDMLSVGENILVPSEGARPTKETLSNPNFGNPPVPSLNPLAMHHMQPSPVYETLRHAHGKPLRPGAVAKLADVIRGVARERLNILLPRGRFDLTQNYAGIVAASVQCHLFRLPLSEAKYILDTINAGSATHTEAGAPDPERYERLIEIVEPVVRGRRREGWDGDWPLLDGMYDLEIDGRLLTDREIAMTVGIVMLGGTETVPKVVAHGLWELQKRPDQLAEVRADLAANVPTAFREMVRLCAPAQWFVRTVQQDVHLAGVDMRRGQRIIYLVPSAARDEREYGADAEEFRWNRPITRWVNFGHGQHFCLGYHLALLEGSIMVEEFLRRVPDFSVIEEKAVRRPSSFQWGYNELPIRVPVRHE